ncbi:DNA-binding MarR family transcriptional regulator [Pseudonocardia cypriaca]|uniref:DNA-binding MarR family transcriptional regulator n=1 Tax=Pseudonocardia cypriaca TaxID=882449 RepID=A0A543GCP7_9PSEU|nr:DNA-binding MarR family transcriptional regulator [Pseudonocardia cypriaca]
MTDRGEGERADAPPRAISVRPPTLLGIPSYLAGNVARAATRTLWRSLAEHGLGLSQHAVLVAIHDFGPLAQVEIADRLDLDRSQVVGFVDALERHGFVTRTRDPRDRRRMLVSMTEAGAAAERRVTEAAQELQPALFAALSPAELDQLVGLLERVLDAHDAARLGRG